MRVTCISGFVLFTTIPLILSRVNGKGGWGEYIQMYLHVYG